LYAFYSANEAMIGNGLDSYPAMPALREALAPMFEGLKQLQGLLASGWDVDGGPGTLLAAGLGHAIAFPTWRSLRHAHGLTNDQAVSLMVGLVVSAARVDP
jgi:hypothetical protein